MNNQPANVSPLWFFTKASVLCALVVVAIMQVRALLWHDGHAMAHGPVSSVTTSPAVVTAPKAPPKTAAETAEDRQLARQKKEKERVERAREAAASPKEPAKPSLTKALMNPETHALIKDEFKHRLDAPYGKLYRALNLEPEKLQELRGLLADKELTLAEGYRLSAESGAPLDASSLAALRADADGPIKELLGEIDYDKYKYYESTLPARNQMNALEQSLSYKSEPLSSEQYDALVSALSALPDPTINPGSGAWLGNYSPELTKESLEIARGILTPSQFVVYEREYESTVLDQEMGKKYAQYFFPLKKNAASGK